MMDDATLAEWERCFPHIGVGPLGALPTIKEQCVICQAVAEIRRLREEVVKVENELFQVEDDKAWLNQDVATHRAVVRELAELLDVDATPEFANEGDLIAWIERKHAVLAHPLVQQAREERDA